MSKCPHGNEISYTTGGILMQKRDYEFKLESSLVQLIIISADPGGEKKKSERLLGTVARQ